jgi:hypothetical protein
MTPASTPRLFGSAGGSTSKRFFALVCSATLFNTMAALCVASASPLVSDAGDERAYLAEID